MLCVAAVTIAVCAVNGQDADQEKNSPFTVQGATEQRSLRLVGTPGGDGFPYSEIQGPPSNLRFQNANNTKAWCDLDDYCHQRNG